MNEIVSIARDALIEGKTEEVIAIADELHETFDDALQALLAALNAEAAKPGHLCAGKLYSRFELDKPGKRFVRVVDVTLDDRGNAISRSVQCFVELSNGLVWKAASWKAPALNYPRGCIFDAKSREAIASRFYGIPDAPYYKELR